MRAIVTTVANIERTKASYGEFTNYH